MQLTVVNENQIAEAERAEINTQIDSMIERHKNNRYEINKLVFESVAALTESENYSGELSSQGAIKRFWGGITGKNAKLRNKIDSSLAAAQYASQRTLQKLAEQNLMSFELIAAVNNKLNASLVSIENEINTIYGTLVTFFKQTKSDIIQLESRVEKLERNVNLLNWQNSIEYQMWNGVEYTELDDVSKIVCLTRDFYDITKGSWTTSDLLLLKTAMATIGIPAKSMVSYYDFISAVSDNSQLLNKLFDGFDIVGIDKYPEYVTISAGIQKRQVLDNEERYLVDNTTEIIRKNGISVTPALVRDDLLKVYERDKACINIESQVNCYDFILEMLYNFEQIKEIETKKNQYKKLEERKERVLKLSQYTDDKEIIDNIDSVAFNQEELEELYEKGIEKIYLCEGEFKIPESKAELKYEIIGDAIVEGLKKDIVFPYDLENIKIGNTIEFGESDHKKLKWLILDVSSDEFIVFLLNDNIPNIYKTVFNNGTICNFGSFDKNNNNKWESSSLRQELNSKFIELYFSDIEKMCILDCFHEDVNCSDKVFLLSFEEVIKYRSLIIKCFNGYEGFWTRSHISQILPEYKITWSNNKELCYSNYSDQCVTPRIRKDMPFLACESVSEAKNYIAESPFSLWDLVDTHRPDLSDEVRPVMKLKLSN